MYMMYLNVQNIDTTTASLGPFLANKVKCYIVQILQSNLHQ